MRRPNEKDECSYADDSCSGLVCLLMTQVPIQRKMIDVGLLTGPELRWLNEYHALVLKKVNARPIAVVHSILLLTPNVRVVAAASQISPLLQDAGSTKALSWLRDSCALIIA